MNDISWEQDKVIDLIKNKIGNVFPDVNEKRKMNMINKFKQVDILSHIQKKGEKNGIHREQGRFCSLDELAPDTWR